MSDCDCKSAPDHKVWCKVRGARRARRAALKAEVPVRPTAAQRRQAEHRELMARRAAVKRLYDAGVRSMARCGA